MSSSPRRARGMNIVLVIAALALSSAAAVAQQPERYKGRPLADALKALQAAGLRIVYTSATVTPDLIVEAEPRATSARQQLDELLSPLGLKARDGPGGTIQIVRAEPAAREPRTVKTGTIEGSAIDSVTSAAVPGVIVRVDGVKTGTRTDADGRFLLRAVPAGMRTVIASAPTYTPMTHPVQVIAGTSVSVTLNLSPSVGTHNEYVTVYGPSPHQKRDGIAAETMLDRGQVERLHGNLADDPMRAVHSFPRVTAVDDFRSEFAVRGSPFRHVDVVVDGVSTQWLQHTAIGRGATGSVAMLGSYLLEDTALRAGAYPRRYSDRLGPQLELSLRQGSRSQTDLHALVSGTSMALVGEGPLGRSRRGSWLVAARRSLIEWPTDSAESTRTAFGFSDAFSKLVYDVGDNQQLALSALGGRSDIDSEDNLAPNQLAGGSNRAAVVTLSWRSVLRSNFVLSQRAYIASHRFNNRYQSGTERDAGTNGEMAYRASITRPVAHGLLEAGAQIVRATIQESPPTDQAGATRIAESAWLRSGYAHFTWAATPSLTLSPGMRISKSTLVPRAIVSSWLLGEWTFHPNWTLTASSGLSQQAPDLREVVSAGLTPLRPERATNLDVGIGHRVTNAIRWQATLFSRLEDNTLREPDLYPRLAGGSIAPPNEHFVNALSGTSRGVELLVDRQSATGLSGWASYSYGKTRYVDAIRGEAFWGDFDQRHALNLFGTYRFSNVTSVGATFRTGSNFPIPAYLVARDGKLFVGDERNRVRLPPYARLDIRADRQFRYLGRRVTLFAEMLNVLNRANAGLANGTIDSATGEAIGFTDALFRRRASAGVIVDF